MRRFYLVHERYMSFFRRFVGIVGGLMVAVEVLFPLLRTHLPKLNDVALAIVMPLGFYLVVDVLMRIGCALTIVELGPQGIRGPNTFGLPSLIPWRSIVFAQLSSLYGIPSIVLKGEGYAVPLVIPLYLRDMPGFVAAVRQYAEPDNPFVQQLDAIARSGIF